MTPPFSFPCNACIYMHFFHLFCGRLNLFCSLSFDHSGFQHLHFRVLMKSDTESHPPACLIFFWFFFPVLEIISCSLH